MHFSGAFQSSPNCVASGSGQHVATLSASQVCVRSTETLQTTAVIDLPSDLQGPVSAFLWSPSSSRILVSAADNLKVFSACDGTQRGTVQHLTSSLGAKPSLIRFGPLDDEVWIFSAFGLKLLIIDLAASKAVEILGPKFHTPALAMRGISCHPNTQHLALLTRTGGKDLLSIHDPASRQVQRSWCPGLVDAQGVAWTPDGQWLMLWDSAAQGRHLLLYTADGQLFKSLTASRLCPDSDADLQLGIKVCETSPSGELCVLGDHSKRVVLLKPGSWATAMALRHPTTIVPKDTLQVWQEQLSPSGGDAQATRSFLRTTQMVSPQTRNSENRPCPDVRLGCSLAIFDASSTLLATRLDESPSTLWIWDVAVGELRAVLLFHSTATAQWHPSIRETLLIKCQVDSRQIVPYVWDPLSNGPIPVRLSDYISTAAKPARAHADWVNCILDVPLLLISDEKNYGLLCLAEPSQCTHTWRPTLDRDEIAWLSSTPGSTDNVNDHSVLEDTFSFKNV